MKSIYFAVIVGISLMASQGFSEEQEGGRSGWRFSVGPTMGGHLKSSIQMRGSRISRALNFSPYSQHGMSQEEAQHAGNQIGSDRVNISEDGRYYIDPDDYAAIPGETVNWYLPGESFNGSAFMIDNAYHETTYSSRSASLRDTDVEGDAGLSLALEREVWRSGRFGLDAGFMFSWLMKDDAFRTSGTMARASATSETGRYQTEIGVESEMASDPWFQNADGSYGGGNFYGPGPILSLGNNISHRWIQDSFSSKTASLYVHSNGDYEEEELAFLLRPWFDVTDWFRLVGTLGVAVSRASLDFTVNGYTNGRHSYHDSQKFDAWDVYGLAGIGGMFRYGSYCLGGDFLAKFLDDDLSVNGRSVQGDISREDWTCRIYVGYEF